MEGLRQPGVIIDFVPKGKWPCRQQLDHMRKPSLWDKWKQPRLGCSQGPENSCVTRTPLQKNLPAHAGDMGLIPGSRGSPEEGHGDPLQYFLPGESHGQRSLAGCSPAAASQRVRHDWIDLVCPRPQRDGARDQNKSGKVQSMGAVEKKDDHVHARSPLPLAVSSCHLRKPVLVGTRPEGRNPEETEQKPKMTKKPWNHWTCWKWAYQMLYKQTKWDLE